MLYERLLVLVFVVVSGGRGVEETVTHSCLSRMIEIQLLTTIVACAGAATPPVQSIKLNYIASLHYTILGTLQLAGSLNYARL